MFSQKRFNISEENKFIPAKVLEKRFEIYPEANQEISLDRLGRVVDEELNIRCSK